MNPRVSRSSALASKATGFPIAKIAAKLAIGYTLDEIVNDITKETPACFEPTLDYVVVKAPRFAFEKFPGADPTLTTTMKSVGEAMSLGRNFIEALGKVMRSLETKPRRVLDRTRSRRRACEELLDRLQTPTDGRLYDIELALRLGATRRAGRRRPPASTRGSSSRSTGWWRCAPSCSTRPVLDEELLRRSQAQRPVGPPDRGAAAGTGRRGRRARAARSGSASTRCTRPSTPARRSSRPRRRTTTAATNSTPPPRPRWRRRPRSPRCSSWAPGRTGSARASNSTTAACTPRPRCREAGFETVMVNCNPETVSTDYDTADRLYFEPLTFEDVLEVFYAESASGAGGPGVVGVIVQLGGQTPLGLAERLEKAGVPIVGTSPKAIDLAEDRGAFGEVLNIAGLPAPRFGTATSFEQARRIAADIGYPGAGPAVLRAGRARHGDRLRRGDPAGLHHPRHRALARASRCWSTGSSRTPSRSTSTRCATAPRSTSAASWSTSRRPASTPATRRARCRR